MISRAQDEAAAEDAPAGEGGDPTAAEDGAPEGGTAVKDSFFRLGFYEWTTHRFQDVHPFFKMTGNKFFKEGNTSLNSTQDNTGLLLPSPGSNAFDKNHEHQSSGLVKLVHGLPPFSLEYIVPTEVDWVTAYSFQLYYTNTWLTDQTAQSGAKRISDVPIIEMRNHFYFFTFSLYGLIPPGRDQTEIYYGLGWAFVETTIRNGFRGHGTINPESGEAFDDLDHYRAEKPVFFQRIGMKTGDMFGNYGVLFELYLINDTNIFKNPFHNSRLLPTPISPIKKRIDLQGLLLRMTWGVYSFWD
ncbi:MAG: hypothetical protein HQM13_10580 [SAR324 cluster bacterium]|nr:hypothetical protein [SAR324 cluster bacterium]